MKNFLLALAVLGVAGLLSVSERARSASVQATNRQLELEVEAIGQRAEHLEQQRAELQRELDWAREQAKAQAPVRPSLLGFVPPDPQQQGGWPTNAPYFYLPKRELPTVRYKAIDGMNPSDFAVGRAMQNWSSAGRPPSMMPPPPPPPPSTNRSWSVPGKLTDDAVLLFGMTPAKRQEVESAICGAWERLRALVMGKAQRVNPEHSSGVWDASEYHVPGLTDEESGMVLEELKADIRQILGTARADYFLGGWGGSEITRPLSWMAGADFFVVFGRGSQGEPVDKVFAAAKGSNLNGAGTFSGHRYLQWVFKDGFVR